MLNLISNPLESPLFIGLVILYFLSSSITTFDTRMIQAVKSGLLPADEPMLPRSAGIFHYINFALIFALAILNWKYAIGVMLYISTKVTPPFRAKVAASLTAGCSKN
jgi:hypothetical protein